MARGGQNLKGMAIGLAAAGYDAMGMDALADRALLTYVDQMERNARKTRRWWAPTAMSKPGRRRALCGGGGAGKSADDVALAGVGWRRRDDGAARRANPGPVHGEGGMRGGASRAAAEGGAGGDSPPRHAWRGDSCRSEFGGDGNRQHHGRGVSGNRAKHSGRALAFGLPAGLLDSLAPIVALRKMAGPLADELGGQVLKRLGLRPASSS